MPYPDDLTRLWPASAVRVSAGDLELRWIDDELLVELAELAGRGIHSPDAMPFEHPWTRGTPVEVARSVLAYQWRARPDVSPSRFVLELAVIEKGVPVGVQGLVADDWSVLGHVRTGSWLGAEHQGRGIGTQMRVMALNLIFAGLDAREASSGAFADNAASNAVSRAAGASAIRRFFNAWLMMRLPERRPVFPAPARHATLPSPAATPRPSLPRHG